MDPIDLLNESWFDALNLRCKKLLRQALFLIGRERSQPQDDMVTTYGFLVFPAAKAYEGFLKDYFLAMGFIESHHYADHYFRIGRSLNPEGNTYHKQETWVYDDISRSCGHDVAQDLWESWKLCRNQVFHFQQDASEVENIDTAEALVVRLMQSMKSALLCEAYAHGQAKSRQT